MLLAEHLGWLATDPIDQALIEEPDCYRFLNHYVGYFSNNGAYLPLILLPWSA